MNENTVYQQFNVKLQIQIFLFDYIGIKLKYEMRLYKLLCRKQYSHSLSDIKNRINNFLYATVLSRVKEMSFLSDVNDKK